MESRGILEVIKSRRSIRDFLDQPVDDNMVEEILEAGRWAPSGLNNQPWRFVVIKDKGRAQSLAQCTKYGHIIQKAPLLIAVFLDTDVMYDYTKDTQACGAAIQNMLLATHGLGLGAVWLGEILKRKADVGSILGAPESMELMALIAIGYPTVDTGGSRMRHTISQIAYKEQCGHPWEKENN